MTVVTISREYGSGGGAIGGAVAERLGWRYVDDDLVFLVAHRAGIDDGRVRGFDQEGFSRLGSFARNCVAALESLTSPFGGPGPGGADAPALPVPLRRFYSARYLHLAQQVIRMLAAHGRTVIMGRGGQVVLRDVPGTLHVRIVAPLPIRVVRVAQREHVEKQEAARRIRRRDAAVAAYLRHYYRVDWNDPLLYHLVLNTGDLGEMRAASVIQYALSEGDRGGSAGVTPPEKSSPEPQRCTGRLEPRMVYPEKRSLHSTEALP